jgi:osmotically-inducible protein OsmY
VALPGRGSGLVAGAQTATLAGAIATTGLTALQGIDDALAMKRGETIIIHGASGGVGTLVIQFAKLRGARVLATASGVDGLELVREMVADLAVDSRHEDVAEAARRFRTTESMQFSHWRAAMSSNTLLKRCDREAGLRIQMVSRRRSQRISEAQRHRRGREAQGSDRGSISAGQSRQGAPAPNGWARARRNGAANPRTVIARDAASFIAPASKEKDHKLMIVMAAGDARRRFQVCSANPIAGTANSAPNWRATMKSDSEIERDVKEELKWNPYLLDATDIGVSVTKGVVTLTGFVKSYFDRYEAETAAKRVAGVVGVANDIEVRIPSVDKRPDPDIARDAVSALKAQLPFSSEHIKVVVENAWVTLEGQVEWQYQKHAAEKAVQRIKGVKGVTNAILLKPKVEPSQVKTRIVDALRRNAEVDANRIQVEANGGEVILKGTVRSWIEREEAERVAWSAPGVTKVEDRIVVAP